MYECEICGKKSDYEGLVGYSKKQFNLCRSHYLKWCKHHQSYVNSHKKIKPNTKAWDKMYEEEEKLFIKWFAKSLMEKKPKNKKINLSLEFKSTKLISVKIPEWVLKELIEEKKGWVEEAEEPTEFEKWIVDSLPRLIKKNGRRKTDSFIAAKPAEIFSKINDGDLGIDIAKKTGLRDPLVYVELPYFEKLGLIKRRRIKMKRNSNQFVFSKDTGRNKLIFLTEKGKRVQELLFKEKILHNIKILSNMVKNE